MAEFNYMYANQPLGNSSMSSMGYPNNMMGGGNAPPGSDSMSMLNHYARSPFTKQQQQQQAAGPGTQVFSSCVLNDPSSSVFCYDAHSNMVVEHNVRQMMASDCSLFIEHIQGYSLVYVPNGSSIEAAAGQAMAHHAEHLPRAMAGGKNGSRGHNAANNGLPREKTSKPCNAFIMYRNHKINELRALMPEINQTDISREAGSRWKTESEDVKEYFRAKYREEKQNYDAKKSKRTRADTSRFGDDYTVFDGSSPSRKKTKNNLGLGIGGNGMGAKPRAHTMPSGSYSASRMGSGADLRKQMAARNVSSGAAMNSSSAYLNDSPYESPELHRAYAELATGMSQHQGQQPSTSSMQTLVSSHSSFVNGMSNVQMFPGSEHDMHGYDHASAAHMMPEQNDLTNSLVNAGLAAGIQMISGGNGEQDGGDMAAAASMAANVAMAAGGFYSTDMGSVEHNKAGFVGQWSGNDQQQQHEYTGINPADTTNTDSVDGVSSAAQQMPLSAAVVGGEAI
ncbi:hypothetical protein BX661DRAFT_171513 [Kickxella alabastrina]|uniref:uncharacterized protein n=1 Tax=Kickxella alabastrina TaxID=61397 RepID=UPI00221FDE3F|nr:uncharacterized protein BX661DRAFT_171513 [Kickxella alabastrina]KAI7826843.1 hypothetical protein BX661DRAFT_171513 [Kickxella alabastrina]